MRFTVVILVVFAFRSVLGQVNLVTHFENCQIDTAHFDDCVKDRLNDLTPYFKTGLRAYGINPFDPFYAPEVRQRRGGPFFEYDLVLRNVTEAGWTQAQITKFRSDLRQNRVELTQFFPDKYLNGHYDVVGTFFGQKVRNSGSWTLGLHDYVQTLTVTKKKFSTKKPSKMAVKCNIKTCKKLELHIGNLAGGRTIIENTLDWIINNAWQPGFVVLAPLINDLVGTAFSEIFTEDFQNFPFEEIFAQRES